jgi:regulator of sirC expression with transglutaminase-like and TPR domain
VKDWTLKSGRTIHSVFDKAASFIPCDGSTLQQEDVPVWLGPTPSFDDALFGPPLTPEERDEVAEHMIAVWKRWAETGEP